MLDRREFMRRTAAAGLSAALWPLTACERSGVGTGEHSGFQPHPPPSGPAREFVRIARPAEVDITPLGMFRRWTYDGSYPGPEIRVREGERLRVRLENRLPDPTTVHWHGVPVPNAMDGVPGVTQDAVEPGGDFIYDFTAAPAGSYLYHSHVGLQLDRGLHGPLVIEETTPHVEYDREATLILDGLLPGPPQPPDLEGGMGRGMMRRRGRGMMEMMDDGTPEYHAFLLNGRAPEDPETIEVGRGERIRLRIMNPSSSTTFRVAVAGHRMQVTHSDGRPVGRWRWTRWRSGWGSGTTWWWRRRTRGSGPSPLPGSAEDRPRPGRCSATRMHRRVLGPIRRSPRGCAKAACSASPTFGPSSGMPPRSAGRTGPSTSHSAGRG